jgi:hypothetical protein
MGQSFVVVGQSRWKKQPAISWSARAKMAVHPGQIAPLDD